jgi:glycosyltransferase involved in cell wall biosynthesis
VKFAIATFHVPHPQGSSAGRQLWAVADALIAAGHDIEGWCWGPGFASLPMPQWCVWSPQPVGHGPAEHMRALLNPRSVSARGGWRPAHDDAVRWADDWASWPAVRQAGGRSVVTVHYDVAIDARVVGWTPARIQDRRAQHRAVRGATTVWALSDRVASRVGAVVVPPTLPIPVEPLPLRDEPSALLFADWSWPANVRALRQLLDAWSSVRERVPGAELVVAGRGSPDVGTAAGVRVIGEVASTVDAMSEAAVLAFPCPPTSGPKLKVLDAFAAGLPVVTTPSGVEGLTIPADAAAVASGNSYTDVLVAVLSDPQRRTDMAERARAAAVERHAPHVAAAARVAAISS